jgi:hypothetical protein
MAEFSTGMWVILAVVGVATILLCVHTLASLVRNEIGLHDLRVEVVTRRNDYLRNLYGADEVEEYGEVEVLEVDEAPEFESERERMEA